MYSAIVSWILLINLSFMFAFPSPIISRNDEVYILDEQGLHPVTNPSPLSSSWMYKRAHNICDYRFQHRPVSAVGSLCAYGQ